MIGEAAATGRRIVDASSTHRDVIEQDMEAPDTVYRTQATVSAPRLGEGHADVQRRRTGCTLHVSAPGHRSAELQVTFAAGRVETLHVALTGPTCAGG
jgi:hypothetical protein